jgi:uncharacterized protein (TIGR02118 family)
MGEEDRRMRLPFHSEKMRRFGWLVSSGKKKFISLCQYKGGVLGMAKLIALYRQPKDKKAFDEHYYNTHTPLVKKIPGLRETRVTKITGAPNGQSEFYLQCDMIFADHDALQQAMASKEMKACSKDLMTFAKGLVTMMIGEEADA